MNKRMKILGVLLALAITGLSVENALTGHGIKGNKNLNSEVLASGSGSDTNSTGTGSDCTSSWPGDCTQTGNNTKYCMTVEIKEQIYDPPVQKGNQTCQKYRVTSKISCDPGGDVDCTPGTTVNTGEFCFIPD